MIYAFFAAAAVLLVYFWAVACERKTHRQIMRALVFIQLTDPLFDETLEQLSEVSSARHWWMLFTLRDPASLYGDLARKAFSRGPVA